MEPSSDSKDILLALHHENSSQARHHEQQRQWATAIVAVATAIVLGSLSAGSSTPLCSNSLLLVHGLFLLTAGAFGVLTSLRHHERSRLHVQRVHAIRKELSRLFPVDVLDLYASANEEHLKKFPLMSNRTARVHLIWQGFHTAIAIMGVILLGLGLLCPGRTPSLP